MPRSFFDLWVGNDVALDEDGMELPDVEAAQQEATRALAGMARDEIEEKIGETTEHMAVEVRDDAGSILKVGFSFQLTRKLSS